MNRINLAKSITETRNSVTWGKTSWGKTVSNNAGPFVFGALLIVCSLAVGCSGDKPKPVSSNNPAPITQPSSTIASYNPPVPLTEAKPAAKKVVKKRPATVTYTDKTYGVSFVYPRRYAIETGDAAKELLVSSPLPMNFVQPGGTALAAVELPETGLTDTDFSSAFFNVSVNNTLTGEQCGRFSVPQPNPAASAPSGQGTSVQSASAPAATEPQGTKLMLGDLELRGAEAVSGEGTRQSDSKYFHVFNSQNGACYEFALNLTTNAQTDGVIKHVDRDKVFARLETILATVKIDSGKVDAEKIDAEKTSTGKKDAGKADAVNTVAEKPIAPNSEIASDPPTSAPAAQSAPVAETTSTPAASQTGPQ